ncbi:MAG TPA: TIGR02449 family protein [Dyella sp.]|uniref:TIGR02449 family protein n=1 Tax=Dyella sp. TaxID=1869338 RepID=UPI002F93F7F1
MSMPEPLQSDAFQPDPIREEVGALNERVDRLLDIVHRLQEENRSLRLSQEQLASERAGLMARNEQARSRVEAMIQRLKALEHSG